MNDYTVYMHISPSNKRYIGITSMKPEYRWNSGKGYKHNKYFTRAIEKYGWDNFQHIIIARGLNEETAKWLEIELIREFESSNRENGYNISLGGESGNHSEETKKKISELNKGENHPFYGTHRSDETKKKISEANIGKHHHSEETRKKISEIHKGKQLSEETKKKLSETKKGENNPMYNKHHSDEAKRKMGTPIICLNTTKIFYSIKEASDYYNCDGLRTYFSRNRKYAGKLEDGTPLVWMYLEDYEKATEEEIQERINSANEFRVKKVICITTNEIFDSVIIASKEYKIQKSGIIKCCNGKLKSCGKLEDGTKLVWKYLEDI